MPSILLCHRRGMWFCPFASVCRKRTPSSNVVIWVLTIITEYTGSPSLPHTHIAFPGRARASDSTLITNGRPLHFQSRTMPFQELLKRQDQVYFDRTHYISKLEDLHTAILFCRPRRFGKSLTISMLQHFHGLQFAREHQSLYKVSTHILGYHWY